MITLVAAIGALGLLLIYDGLSGRRQRRPSRAARAATELVQEAGVPSLTPGRLVAASVGAGLGATFLVAGVTGSAIVAAVFGLGAAGLPLTIVRARRLRRRRAFREAWPDAVASLISGVRAGVSLPEACVALQARGPDDLRAGFAAFTSTYRATGSFRAGIRRLQQHQADPVADRVGAALALAHEVGGTDLVRVLRTLGDFVREDLRVRKEIEARWSWTVTAARVAAAAPWVVLLMMSTRPEAASAYNTPGGAAVVVGGAVATVVGYRLMLRAARLPEPGRIGP